MSVWFKLSHIYTVLFSMAVFLSCLNIAYIGYLSHASTKVLFLMRIVFILVVLFMFLVERKKVSPLLIVMTIFILFIVGRTYLMHGETVYSIQQLSIPYLITLYVEYLKENDLFCIALKTFKLLLGILIVIDIITMIKYPNGLYMTIYPDNWFLGYKTERLEYYLPFLVISAFLDLEKTHKIKGWTFFYSVILCGIFLRESATAAMWSLILLCVLFGLINLAKNVQPVMSVLRKLMDSKVIILIYSFVTLSVFSIQSSKIMQYIILDIFRKDITLHTRFEIWEECFNALQGNVGLGMGYLSYEKYQILTGNPFATSAHNMVLQILMMGGVMGLVLYFLFISTTVKGSRLTIIQLPAVAGIIIVLLVGVTSAEVVFSMFGFFFYSLVTIRNDDEKVLLMTRG